jgi:hypothetical protein
VFAGLVEEIEEERMKGFDFKVLEFTLLCYPEILSKR